MGVTESIINKLWGRLIRDWVAKEAVGAAGGIIMIWKCDQITVEEVNIKGFSVSLLLNSSNWTEKWKLTVVYGPARARERIALWTELRDIREQRQGPWMVGGNFNTIRLPEEKNRMALITTSMRNLSNFINDSALIDLLLEGARFTWTNNQENLIMSRLDRILISMEWEEAFPLIYQRALPKPTSDHNPILLELSNFLEGPRPFKFNLALCETPKFVDHIKLWWNEEYFEGWKGFILFMKLKHIKMRIKEWQKSEIEASRFGKEDVLSSLESLERKEEDSCLTTEESMERLVLLEEYEEIIRREEIAWRQKSRSIWVKEGDHNSTFPPAWLILEGESTPLTA
ncbi:uncharacterized protein LOC143888801 [Tasmannia lanceolata]|uniref:uncharacterized protein LOC143888801 n=1 Tax=Tasmannia lanceolata TaxID=3420 RepID=UPI0040633BCD